MTRAQLAFLGSAMRDENGRVELSGQRGLAYAAKQRMAKRLCEVGLRRPYVHGGYEITDAGVDAWENG